MVALKFKTQQSKNILKNSMKIRKEKKSKLRFRNLNRWTSAVGVAKRVLSARLKSAFFYYFANKFSCSYQKPKWKHIFLVYLDGRTHFPLIKIKSYISFFSLQGFKNKKNQTIQQLPCFVFTLPSSQSCIILFISCSTTFMSGRFCMLRWAHP